MRKIYSVSCSTFTKDGYGHSSFSITCFSHSKQEAKGFALEKCVEYFSDDKYYSNYLIAVTESDMEWLTKCCEEYNTNKIPAPQERNPLLEIKL